MSEHSRYACYAIGWHFLAPKKSIQNDTAEILEYEPWRDKPHKIFAKSKAARRSGLHGACRAAATVTLTCMAMRRCAPAAAAGFLHAALGRTHGDLP